MADLMFFSGCSGTLRSSSAQQEKNPKHNNIVLKMIKVGLEGKINRIDCELYFPCAEDAPEGCRAHRYEVIFPHLSAAQTAPQNCPTIVSSP